jgi:hypothetical protein
MSTFTHSVQADSVSITAGTVTQLDLPVQPISHLLITLDCLNATNMASLANLAATISRLEVLFQNSPIISLSGADLLALSIAMLKGHTLQENFINTDNAVRSATLIVPFGRQLYNVQECFPRTTRGDFRLRIDWAASFTNLDTLTLSVTSVELPGATPDRFLRATTLSATPSATGDFDIDIPLGNTLLALLLWGTTIPTGTTATKTIQEVTLLVNDKSEYYHTVPVEPLHAAMGFRAGDDHRYDAHFHAESGTDTAAAEWDDGELSNYTMLDLDPTGDGQFALETAQLSDLKLRIDAGDTNPVRVIPIELVAAAA